jgi:REP element-mobilizing transposase RayT
MPRKARVEFPGAVYHLLDRGDRREAIFVNGADRENFLRTLGQACGRCGWRVHALVLMTNHYHLLVETPEANLVAGMRWFQTTYTVRFNRRHRLSGHLFQGRYKAVAVDPEAHGYLVTLSDYIHLNPVRAGMISLDARLFDYRWSSYRWMRGAPNGRSGLRRVESLASWGWRTRGRDGANIQSECGSGRWMRCEECWQRKRRRCAEGGVWVEQVFASACWGYWKRLGRS